MPLSKRRMGSRLGGVIHPSTSPPTPTPASLTRVEHVWRAFDHILGHRRIHLGVQHENDHTCTTAECDHTRRRACPPCQQWCLARKRERPTADPDLQAGWPGPRELLQRVHCQHGSACHGAPQGPQEAATPPPQRVTRAHSDHSSCLLTLVVQPPAPCSAAHLDVLAAADKAEAGTVELAHGGEDDRLGGHVEAGGEGLGRKQDLQLWGGG